MKNIFENAYFGKPYKTRDGRKAIYRAHYCDHHLFTENSQFTCNDEGCVVNALIPIPEFDIISEWQEEINEVELDKLAIEEKKKYKEQLPFYYEFPHSEIDLNIRCMGYIDGFKDCYRKVIEKYRSTQNAKN